MTVQIQNPRTIQQVSSDPSSPYQQQAWVLKSTGGAGSGEAYGLLLALTQPGGSTSYQFSYRTLQDTTVRSTLS